MKIPKAVKIVEVGPRDGLQNEKIIIETADKIQLINRLSDTGLQCIETTSFVSPKWIPQLKDAEPVLIGIHKNTSVSYPVLVPNVQGFQRAVEAGAREIAVFCAATETFSEKNTHCSIEQSLERIQAVMDKAKKQNIFVRGYISCALGCPYEGQVKPEIVQTLAKKLIASGCDEIALGDTIGVGTPLQAQNLIQLLANEIPIQKLALHFHDTYGLALANIYACLELGVEIIDSAISGLGGCPYAKGASGNVATEDVLYMLQGLGIKTGIDLEKMVEISEWITTLTGKPALSKVTQAKLGSSHGRIS